MEDKIKELKSDIADAENQLKDPDISSDEDIVELLNDAIKKMQKEIDELEVASAKEVFVAEKNVMKAEKNVMKAETKTEKAEAKEQLKEAKEVKKEAEKDIKEIEKIAEKVDKVAEKVDKVTAVVEKPSRQKVIGRMEKKWSGKAKDMAVKSKDMDMAVKSKDMAKIAVKSKDMSKAKETTKSPKAKASSAKVMVVPKNVKVEKLAISKRKLKAKVKAKTQQVAKAKVKTARAFGQVIEYKNDIDFCDKLKAAFKKRRAAAKLGGKRRKTKPVFGLITTSVKNAVSKALHSVSHKEIEKNPKQFLVKAERLEKSAMRFLEDFKSILGSDFKKSEITSEFGELEKAIKQFVAKVTK